MPEPQRGTLLSEDGLIRRLVELVDELGLDRRDFVIFGSGPLLAHGLRSDLRDLDVVARGATWDLVEQHGRPTIGTVNGARMAGFDGGSIQFSRGWISDDYDADELIDRAEFFDGLPFARLSDVLRYKKVLQRAKDSADIRLIECWENGIKSR